MGYDFRNLKNILNIIVLFLYITCIVGSLSNSLINSWIDPLLRIVSHWIPAGIELVPFDLESPALLSVLWWKLNFLSIKFWNSIVVAQFLRLNFWSSNLEGQILKLNFWGSIFRTGPGLFSYMSPKEICLTTCKLEADILKEHF